MPSRLARGQRVGERYRLERELGRGEGSVTWEATDERLDRSVAVKIFDPGIDQKTFMRKAGLAASLTHPRVVRVFDTGHDGGRFFTISELLPASLGSTRRPLLPDQALAIATDIAEALYYAHDRGIAHGHLHEGNVLLSESGAKVGDFALATNPDQTNRSDDLVDFGRLLRRTAEAPPAGPHPGLSRIAEGLAAGDYEDARRVLEDLRGLRPPPAKAVSRPPRRSRTAMLAVAALIAIAAFGATRLGERSPRTRFAPEGRIEGIPVQIVAVEDFDPFGDDRENPRTVANIADGDPQTFWSTERYRASPDFNAAKPGVGVILDLGAEVEIGKAQVLFAGPGCPFELRRVDDRTQPLEEWEVVAGVAEARTSAPIIFGAARARYWLLWITRLVSGSPGAGNAYACAVAEVDLFRP